LIDIDILLLHKVYVTDYDPASMGFYRQWITNKYSLRGAINAKSVRFTLGHSYFGVCSDSGTVRAYY